MFMTIVLFVVAAVFAVAVVAAFRLSPNRDPYAEFSPRQIAIGVAGIAGILGAVVAAVACFTIVQPKTVGVPVTFGDTGSPKTPGLHAKLPWTDVVKIDTTQQVDNYNDGKQETDHSTISVRLGNGSNAEVYASIAWEANGEVANKIYGSYRDDDPTAMLYQRLVAPNFKQAAQVVLGEYDPTAAFKSAPTTADVTGEDVNFSPDYDKFASDVREQFEKYISARGDFVTVLDVKVSLVKLDKSTQKRINEYQQEIQKTRIAQQAVQTASEQAKANKILADSLAKTPDAAAAYCFSLIEQNKLNPPVGFSCYPGSGSQLILPGGSR